MPAKPKRGPVAPIALALLALRHAHQMAQPAVPFGSAIGQFVDVGVLDGLRMTAPADIAPSCTNSLVLDCIDGTEMVDVHAEGV